jgi:O-antigen/teichoic acid export membrane protein
MVFGKEFTPSGGAVRALAVGTITNVLFQVLGSHLASRRLLTPLAKATAAGLAVNLIANLVFIPSMGIVGAGLASSLSYSVTGLLVTSSFIKETGVPLREVFILTGRECRDGLRAASARICRQWFSAVDQGDRG